MLFGRPRILLRVVAPVPGGAFVHALMSGSQRTRRGAPRPPGERVRTKVRLTGSPIDRHACHRQQDPPRRPQVRASTEFSNRIDSLPRLPPGSAHRSTTHHHATSAPRDRNARPITPCAAARKNHRSHAHANPSHVLGWTCRIHAPPPPPGHRRRRRPPLLLHERLRQLPGGQCRPPRGCLPHLRLPPPHQLAAPHR